MGFLPRPVGATARKIVGEIQSSFGYMRRQTWSNALATDADRLLNDQATSNTVVTAVTSFLAQPDFARQITVTPGGTTASVPAGDVTIVGTNIRGEVISDVVTFLANASTVGATTKAFKTVTSITFPVQDGAGATYDVGINDALGLDRCMTADEVQSASMDGTFEATRPTVTYHVSDVSKNTVTPNTALNAAKDLRVVYIATEKTGSVATTA